MPGVSVRGQGESPRAPRKSHRTRVPLETSPESGHVEKRCPVPPHAGADRHLLWLDARRGGRRYQSDGLWAPANTHLNVGREEQVRRAQPRQALWACGLPECHGGWNRFPCLKYFSLAGNRRTNVEIMSTTRVVRGTRSRVSICLLSGVHLLGRAFDKLGSSSALFATHSASQNRAWRVVGSHELRVEAMILHEAPCLARKG